MSKPTNVTSASEKASVYHDSQPELVHNPDPKIPGSLPIGFDTVTQQSPAAPTETKNTNPVSSEKEKGSSDLTENNQPASKIQPVTTRPEDSSQAQSPESQPNPQLSRGRAAEAEDNMTQEDKADLNKAEGELAIPV